MLHLISRASTTAVPVAVRYPAPALQELLHFAKVLKNKYNSKSVIAS
jgi:hypothetical protein